MLTQEILRKKRDRETLAGEEIEALVEGIADGSVSEGQIAAFTMAVCLNGLSREETVSLTLAMRNSGEVLNWVGLGLDGPVLDKHSTGGIGDVVSLILGPLVAACGGYVPMISGRGLGHTGGTLDKLESIPGYTVRPDPETFRRTVRKAGVAIIGQTDRLAPADARIYAVRDVTATVESIALLTSSILSKKLAAGLEGLVMDVKTGNGAFLVDPVESEKLARSLVEVAEGAGLPTVACLTDMSQCLAWSAGNAVEVREAISCLRNEPCSSRLRELTLTLTAEMLALSGLAPTVERGFEKACSALESGFAAERFARMVSLLGGPEDLIDHPERHLPTAALVRPVLAATSGWIRSIDTRGLGWAVVELGGGRHRPSDPVDPAVGLTGVTGLGREVSVGDPLVLLHARDEGSWEAAARRIRAAYEVGEGKPEIPPLVLGKIVGPALP